MPILTAGSLSHSVVPVETCCAAAGTATAASAIVSHARIIIDLHSVPGATAHDDNANPTTSKAQPLAPRRDDASAACGPGPTATPSNRGRPAPVASAHTAESSRAIVVSGKETGSEQPQGCGAVGRG